MRERSALIDKEARPLSTTDVVPGIPTLDVNILGGSTSGIQYPEGDTTDPATGTAILIRNTANELVVPSDADPVPVDVFSSVLPTGAATAAKQDTGNASLASIDSKLTAPISVSAASLPLPTGAATAANQVTEIAAIASVETSVDAQFNPFSAPPTALSFVVTYPTVLQTVYRFYTGNGGTGTLLKTVTLNFTSAQTPGLTSGDIT